MPRDHPLSAVNGVNNAILIEGEPIGEVMFYGPGAGAGPTASAVVSDIVDIATGRLVHAFGVPTASLVPSEAALLDDHSGSYYVRLMVDDQPGVFAEIAAELAKHKISIEGVIQRSRSETEAVPVVMTTHETSEAAIQKVLSAFEALDAVREKPHVIRIESI